MIETAFAVPGGRISGTTVPEILDLRRTILRAAIQLLCGVETITALSAAIHHYTGAGPWLIVGESP